MSISHNSFHSSSDDDSMPRHVNSMLHETFEEPDVKLYQYLMQKEEEESLPELASVTTNSMASTPRIVSMEESSIKNKGRRRESSFVLGSPRRRPHDASFGWTSPSPKSHMKRESSISISPLSPYLTPTNENEMNLQQQVASLKRQLQQAQDDLAHERQAHEDILEQEQHEYKQRLQNMQQQHELELQQHDDYQSTLVETLRQRDEELEAREMEMDQLQQHLLQQEQRLENEHFQQDIKQNMTFSTNYDIENEHETLEQQHVHDNCSVELNEMIEECQRELHEFGAQLGLTPDYDTMSVPREINTTLQHQEHEHPYSLSMVSSSVDLAQSLVRMLQEESLSNEEENAIWEKLAALSEQLGKDDVYHYQVKQHDAAATNMVPLDMYQQMQHKCDSLEQERTLLKQEFLQVVQSTRTSHALQLQIMIGEIQEEAQRQVQAVLNGKQEGLVFGDHHDVVASQNT